MLGIELWGIIMFLFLGSDKRKKGGIGVRGLLREWLGNWGV